jgi:hypothetical protein
MSVNFHFHFKTEDAIMTHADGTICIAQADLCGTDSADGAAHPKGVMCHAVTIRCDHEKGTLGDPDPENFTPIDEVTHEQVASWLTASLKGQIAPRDSGKANMYEYYCDYIEERIAANTEEYERQMSSEFVPPPAAKKLKQGGAKKPNTHRH